MGHPFDINNNVISIGYHVVAYIIFQLVKKFSFHLDRLAEDPRYTVLNSPSEIFLGLIGV